MKYEIIIGLEIHAELKTKTKIFCSCPTSFGAAPNTMCCPTCMGHPGTLPTLNRRAVELGLRAGLALGSIPADHSRMDRKHYFYPDLPKGYQISQNEFPLCRGGSLTFDCEGREYTVPLRRMHIEEDAGKLIHRDGVTFIDHNRSGVPLLEIVTEPTMHTGAQAAAFLKALREVLVTLGVSDCKMQEGGMRCDVNVSIHLPGTDDLGVRTEIKNINSFAFVEKAIKYEVARQTALLDAGEEIKTQTLRYDEATGTTQPMRQKEKSLDYCYLPEPNLPTFYITSRELSSIGAHLPPLPRERALMLAEEHGISKEDGARIAARREVADYFDAAVTHTGHPRHAANLLLSYLLPLWQESGEAPVRAERLAQLAQLLGEGRINNATARALLMRLTDTDFDPLQAVRDEGLEQITDAALLGTAVQGAIDADPRAVADYKGGKAAAINRLLGAAIRAVGGKADPNLIRRLLTEELEKH